jgi:hypothetical protein
MSNNELKAEHLRLIKSERWSFEDIIAFLPKQISLRNLDQELADALADDTHEISIHLTRQYTKATKKHGQVYYAWNKERRFFFLMLSTMFYRNLLLEKTVGLPLPFRKFSEDQGWTLGFERQLNKSKKHEYRYNHTMENNLPFYLRPIGESSKVTEISYIKSANIIQSQYINRRLSKGSLNLNLSTLLNRKVHRELIEDFWHQSQPFLEDEQSPLEFAKSLLKEKQNSNKFTRKFSRYIVDCVNGYWFRVYHVEKNNHGKIKLNKTRYVPVKNYSTFGKALCLYHGCSGNEKHFYNLFNNEQKTIALQTLVPIYFENNLKIVWDWVYKSYIQKRNKFKFHQNEGVELEETSLKHYQPPDDDILCSITLEKDFHKYDNSDLYYCKECGYESDAVYKINSSPVEKKFSEIEIKKSKSTAKSREVKSLMKQYNKKKSWQMKLIESQYEVLRIISWDKEQVVRIKDGLSKEMKTLEQIKVLKNIPEHSDNTIIIDPEQKRYNTFYKNELVANVQDASNSLEN